MQVETLDKFAVIYREKNCEKTFVEIQKRLRPLIVKRSSGARHILSEDDIGQTAALAIAIAVLTYDPARGPFAAFVVAFIMGAVKAETSSRDAVRRPEGNVDRLLVRGRRARNMVDGELLQGRSYADAVATAAAHFGVPIMRVEEALNGPHEIIADQIRPWTFSSGVIEDALSSGSEHDAAHRMVGDQQRIVIERAMSCLTDRERLAMELRLRADGPPTTLEAADILGVHFSNVPKVVRRAMEKMRNALSSYEIQADDVSA